MSSIEKCYGIFGLIHEFMRPMPSVVTMAGVLTPTFLRFKFKSTISINI